MYCCDRSCREYKRAEPIQLHCKDTASAYGRLSSIKKDIKTDFPGGLAVKNPPGKAGDVSLIPGPGTKIPHALKMLLNPCATARESVRLNRSFHIMQRRSCMPRLRPDAAK